MVVTQLQREFVDSSIERSLNDLLAQLPTNRHPRPISILDIKVPDTEWSDSVARWTKDVLTPGLYNHSRRSFFFASALLDPELGKFPNSQSLFPAQTVSDAKKAGLEENMWLAAMLHDVTLVPEVQDDLDNQLSFEIQGGILAHEYLSYPQPQVSSTTRQWGTSSNNRATPASALSKYQIGEIVESIILHTDSMQPGKINLCAQVTHLGIMLDAIGGGPPTDILRMWHPETIANGAKEWPRMKGIPELVEPLKRELQTKPGCHITTGVRAYPLFEMMQNNPYFKTKE